MGGGGGGARGFKTLNPKGESLKGWIPRYLVWQIRRIWVLAAALKEAVRWPVVGLRLASPEQCSLQCYPWPAPTESPREAPEETDAKLPGAQMNSSSA